MMKILVTAVGGDLGQSVIKCLRESSDCPHLFGCDMNPYAGGRSDVDTFLQAPPVRQGEAYKEFLRQTVRAHNIDYVFPLSDLEIGFINAERAWFSRLDTRWMMNAPDIIDTFMDKYTTVEFLKARGLPFPRTFLVQDYQGQLGFPLILKLRRSSGGQGLFLVTNQDQLDYIYRQKQSQIHDIILQEYIPDENQEYTSGIFSDGSQVLTITFLRKLAPGGFSSEAILVQDPVLTAFAENLGQTIAFKGSLNVQFRRKGQVCIPFEINPRFSSTVYLRHHFGFTDVKWCLDLEQGKTISYTPLYQKGIAVRKFSETFFDME